MPTTETVLRRMRKKYRLNPVRQFLIEKSSQPTFATLINIVHQKRICLMIYRPQEEGKSNLFYRKRWYKYVSNLGQRDEKDCSMREHKIFKTEQSNLFMRGIYYLGDGPKSEKY